ncbi:EAL domain-containing protein [Microbulbifer thermotolerans]|uniref:Diguanylate cyclase n=1 Tax=Microbulbifer thermotolerans TaxID=252514 RepID=A0A143HIW7_MICTH|nr:EAL domain-containing protein [Microbulbifer thermotolerans]AMX01447.1 diguanylate cyclase [Microbulbifer thermotolerans]MCX2781990.1 EAL domain-containing protein [Microbulbifer thermotolerans]MCX2783252.1 EAL domain-containing protein [Microbulbifer thermotolerans]MCX2796304.1 EAL domain-containing protein [Microbulbifer thermotolerans]MCX2800334.1 EAL domain-containing protein [Microbulbifer thermotolerans]
MSSNDTIRLLLIHDTPSEAQRLVSMLHNAGRSNRAQHVASEAALTKLLQDKTWDLLIAEESSKQLPAAVALRTISKLQKDVPVILLTEREGAQPVVEGLKLGARDVVTVDEDQHLLLVIQREMTALDNRRQARLHDRRYHATLQRAKELLDSSKDAIAYISDGLIVYANESFAERFGYKSNEDVEYQPLIDMLAEAEQEEAREFLKQCTIDNNEVEAKEWKFTAKTASGQQLPTRAEVLSTIYDEERCLQVRIAARGGDAEQLEAQLSDIKNRDPLTGLYNRQHFLQLFDSAIKSAAGSQRTGGLMYIEVDRFEEAVQKAVGVAGADAMLKGLAQLLQSSLRRGDIVARYGEESFCLLIPDTTPDSAEHRAEEIVKKIADTIFDAAGKTVQITASVGISLFSEASAGAQKVLDQALEAHDQALAKSEQGGAVALYEPDTSQEGDVDTYRRARVVQALEAGNLKLLYQPILSLQGTGEQLYEVLVRLVDGKDELAPVAFLEALGDAGLSSKMDRWVILTAIKSAAAQRAAGKDISLLLHITAASLVDSGLPAWLGVAFKAAKVPPKSVVFQLRQEDINSNLHAARDFSNQVRELGCRVAICHFGTGLNPFKALEHVNVDVAKVDPSFVREVQDEGESSDTLANLIQQLGESDIKVIVPHVEQASMLPTLWQTGTDYIQGYYVQPPADEMNFDFSLD